MASTFKKNLQYLRFCTYGFLKNLKFYEPFFMAFLLTKLTENYSQIGIIYSIRFFVRALFEIPSGLVADSLGRKGSLIFSYSLYISSFFIFYLADGFKLLIIASILFGMADSFRTGTHKAMIIEYLKLKGWQDQKTSYYGNTRSWSQTGSAVSSLIVFVVFLYKPDYSFVFLITIIPYILGLINLLSYPNYLNISHKIIKNTKKKSLRNSISENLEIFKKTKNIKKLIGTSLLFGYHHSLKDYLQIIILSISIISLPPYLNYFNEKDSSVILPLVYFIIYFISTIASRKAAFIRSLFIADTKTIKFLLVIASIIGIAISLAYYYNFLILGVAFFISIFILVNFQRPNVVSFIASTFDNKNMATVLSIESQLGSIFASVFALICGYIANKFGISIALGIISFLLLLLSSINWFNDNEDNK